MIQINFHCFQCLEKSDAKSNDLGIIKDDLEETYNKISNTVKDYDLIVTSGGVSRSKTDVIGKFFQNKGKILFLGFQLNQEDHLPLEK